MSERAAPRSGGRNSSAASAGDSVSDTRHEISGGRGNRQRELPVELAGDARE